MSFASGVFKLTFGTFCFFKEDTGIWRYIFDFEQQLKVKCKSSNFYVLMLPWNYKQIDEFRI